VGEFFMEVDPGKNDSKYNIFYGSC